MRKIDRCTQHTKLAASRTRSALPKIHIFAAHVSSHLGDGLISPKGDEAFAGRRNAPWRDGVRSVFLCIVR
jgi:hypothetical protein